MSPLQTAIYLTSIGLGMGKKYSYLDVSAGIEYTNNKKEFVVRHEQDEFKFKTSSEAGQFFTLYVNKLRRG